MTSSSTSTSGGVLTVGLYTTVDEKTKTRINNKFSHTDYVLEFTKFDSYQTHTTLPDVFVVDSLLLPELVHSNKVLQLQEDNSSSHFSFAVDASKVDGKVYGVPQYISSQFLFYPSSDKDKYNNVKSLSDVVAATENLVYPRVSEDYTVAINYYAATGSLPKSNEVSQEFYEQYRKVVNGTAIQTVDEYFQNGAVGALVTYSQELAGRNGAENSLDVATFSTNSGKKIYFTDVVVVNAQLSEEKRNAAKQLATVIASLAETDKYYLPASKAAFEQAASGNSFLKKIYAVVTQDEAVAEAFRFETNHEGVQKIGRTILPHIQHSSVATIRTLSADVVQKANSGHPGMPIGMAAIAYTLWSQFYNSAPNNSKWINRDRFVLSNGHGCVLQYVLLHLAGFKVTLDDLKNFRQLESITPGHPEYMWTDGIDATTGPLGQGVANLVGMAMAQKHLSARFSTEQFDLLNHHIYGFCSDGDLMEGVALEALAQAGHHKLNNLTLIYDDNKITIDGSTSLAMTENMEKILQGYGWHTQVVEGGDADLVAMKQAIINARKQTDKPQMILLRTTIGYSSTKQGTAGVHGSPLGSDSLKALKKVTGFNPDETFVIPEKVLSDFRKIGERGNAKYDAWQKLYSQYKEKEAEKYQQFEDFLHQRLPADWDKCLPDFSKKGDLATRQCSSVVLNAIAPVVGNLIGGSADLTPSTLTSLDISKDFQPDSREGRYLRFGVREHSMISIGNGMCYYGGLKPYVSTFLIFGGYGLGAIRLGALSHLPLTYVFTHDSIGLGEDGPTHQPIEMLPLLRSIPNLVLFRPADGRETNAAYKYAVESTKTPTAMAFSRQKAPLLENSSIEGALKGAYKVYSNGQFDTKPDIILIGTGTEVGIAIDAAKELSSSNIKVNVISMPSWELFDEQDVEYRKSILIPGVPVLSVEASSTQGWTKYAHAFAGMTTFGASGPYEKVYEKFGITAQHVAQRCKKIVTVYHSSNPAPLLQSIAPEL